MYEAMKDVARVHSSTDHVGRQALLLLAALSVLAANVRASGPSKGRSTPSQPATADVLERILSDWERKRNQVKTIHYIVSGTALVPKGAFADDSMLPKHAKGVGVKEDYFDEYSADLLVDFRENRFRLETRSAVFCVSTAEFQPTHDLWAFNGKELRCRMIGVTENRGSVYSPQQPEFGYYEPNYPVLTTDILPMFYAHGVVSTAAGMIPPAYLGAGPSRDQLIARASAFHQGRECVVLRTVPTGTRGNESSELWVDVARQSAVVRVVRFQGRHLEASLEIDYRETADGRVLSGWRYTRFEKIPWFILTADVRAFELNTNVADSDFELHAAPGMVVQDDIHRTSYVLGPGGEHIPYSEAFRTKTPGVTRRLVGLLVFIAVGGAALILWRRAVRSHRVRA